MKVSWEDLASDVLEVSLLVLVVDKLVFIAREPIISSPSNPKTPEIVTFPLVDLLFCANSFKNIRER
jgi:hypothetical protein